MQSERKSQDGLGGSVGRAPGVVKTKAERSCAVVTGVEVGLVQTEKRELRSRTPRKPNGGGGV